MLKMYTNGGKWIVKEDYKVSIFDKSIDAWRYIFILKEIRTKAPCIPKSLYPVRTLNPFPIMFKKKIIHIIGETV